MQIKHQFEKKIKSIPVFLDFCYIYYIHHFDEEAPFHKLPSGMNKYNLIISACNGWASKYAEINKTFKQIITNKILTDFRMENPEYPPYLLRTTLDKEEIVGNLTKQKPLFKKLLECMMKLKND